MKKKLCKICHKNPAVIPDRNKFPARRNEICIDCHSKRLKEDFLHILDIERKRNE